MVWFMVALGGAVGSVLRYGASRLADGGPPAIDIRSTFDFQMTQILKHTRDIMNNTTRKKRVRNNTPVNMLMQVPASSGPRT